MSDTPPRTFRSDPPEGYLASVESQVSGQHLRKTTSDAPQRPSDNHAAFAVALRDVVTAAVRQGVEQGMSPPVDEALSRVIDTAPHPTPVGVSRWTGRLKGALAAKDVEAVALLLQGALMCARDLTRFYSKDIASMSDPDPHAISRLVELLGGGLSPRTVGDRIQDRVLIEVGRQWAVGLAGTGIERRYLVDLTTHEVFREERPARGTHVSLGPCPRSLYVGYAEIELSTPPRRIHIHQYQVSAFVLRSDWLRVAVAGERSFTNLIARFRQEQSLYPGQSEPFVLITPKQLRPGDNAGLLDEADLFLPFTRRDQASAAQTVEIFLNEQGPGLPFWVAGRLSQRKGRIEFYPCSVGVISDGETRFCRIE